MNVCVCDKVISDEMVAVLDRSDVTESLIVCVVDRVKSLERVCVRETSGVMESLSDGVPENVCVVDSVWSLVNVFVAD